MYNWFKIFNAPEFMATGLVSRTYKLNLGGIGQKDVLVTLGNGLGITYEGYFLVANLNDLNPSKVENYAIYTDENSDVFLGVAV